MILKVPRSREWITLIGILNVLFLSCSKQSPIAGEQKAPQLTDLIAPEVLYADSPIKHILWVRVTDPQGLDDIKMVSYRIFQSDLEVPIFTDTLHDDGCSGDIIPKDGIYTGQINSEFAKGQTGLYWLRVKAVDKSENQSNELSSEIEVKSGVENLSPVLSNPVLPDTILLDSMRDFLTSVEVFDPQGLEDVVAVIYQVYPPTQPVPSLEDTLKDDGTDGDLIPGDGTYSRRIDTSFARGQTGDFFFRFQAIDRAGNQSNPPVRLVKVLSGVNLPPLISNLVAPDTVSRSVGGEYLLTLDVTDPQGLDDIARVFFNSYKPDSTPSTGNPFLMRDDGQGGDVVEGDGTYSYLLIVPVDPPIQLGDYRFEFQAEDKSGAKSNLIIHIITVVE